VAWRLTGDEDSYRLCTAIDCLVFLAGENFQSFAGLEDEVVMVNFEGQLSIQHVEELAGARMVVAYLAGAGRHELFNDA
jgi:hypothetical protein